MVVLTSCSNTVLLLVVTAVVAIQSYHQNPANGETSLLGYKYEEENGLNKRDSGTNVMWIGPRLGRRKRSEDETGSGNDNTAEKNGEAVMEFLQDTPWAFVALKGSKRRTVNFIPRLGRDSEEEFSDRGLDGSFAKSRGGSQIVRPFGGGNNFTPRLGRFAGLYNRDRL
ncbi:hypothetical protein RUM44_007694 [Polyplax serrata]|uniref:Uncharacterized protein n=1 Tax=Polyplax serrata TaxID=468196 RepID=A0ABR1B735_POLSC